MAPLPMVVKIVTKGTNIKSSFKYCLITNEGYTACYIIYSPGVIVLFFMFLVAKYVKQKVFVDHSPMESSSLSSRQEVIQYNWMNIRAQTRPYIEQHSKLNKEYCS